MINSYNLLKKYPSVEHNDHPDTSLFVVQGLEKTIDPKNFMENKEMCHCDLCTKEAIIDHKSEDFNLLEARSKSSIIWLKRLLDCLCL